MNLFWLVFRIGSKPTRINYPCQRTALSNFSFTLSVITPVSLATSFTMMVKDFFSKNSTIILSMLLIGTISGGIFLKTAEPKPFQEIQLTLNSQTASIAPASDIFVVNGRKAANIERLMNLMGSQGLLFYNSSETKENQGPDGLIASNDVVLLKINAQWPYRGGTNTDLLKEIVQAIINHPDGFTGEIVVADNGQGRGNLDWTQNNAENRSQSAQNVVDLYSVSYSVSTYNWQAIRGHRVQEYSDGDTADGYCLNETADAETGIKVSYPKFKTSFGTNISLKHGIWNGNAYETRLKVINLPVLKSHFVYGVTGVLKNYMGVQSEGEANAGGLANGHKSVATGGMGTLMVECGLPVLSIIDAIWINANPSPSSFQGPSTPYELSTRVNVIIAGRDPVALDYWAAKYVLMKTSNEIGYEDTRSLDPENTEKTVLEESFGVWFRLTQEELERGGFQVTSDPSQMNVYVDEEHESVGTSSTTTTSSTTPAPQVTLLIASVLTISFLALRKRRQTL
ncbi:MAG: DUF362 domain-containing protein [Candidatus Heimdallarchaeota archaeon]